MKRLDRLRVLITIILISIVLSTAFALAASRISSSFQNSGNIVDESEYVIYEEGSMYYAQAANGNVAFSSTNAATVINSAFGNLTSGRTWQKMVYLKGNFTVSSVLYVPSYTHVVLDGAIYLASLTNRSIFQNANVGVFDQYITIEGGSLYGNSANQGSGTPAVDDLIYFAGACDSEVRNMYISDSYSFGVSFNGGCNRTKVTNCIFSNNGQSATTGGIYMSRAFYQEGNAIQNCIINGSGQHGIYWGDQSVNGLISNCTITYWSRISQGSAISIRGNNTLITDNQISNGIGGSTCSGIEDQPDHKAYNVTVRNNKILNSGNHGITVYASNWHILGNTVDGCPQTGVYLYGSSYDRVENNYIQNCGRYGMQIYNGSSYNNILSNSIMSNGASGIRIYDSATPCLNNTILDNSITNNAGYGIYEQDLSNYTRIIGNLFTSNTLGALSLTGTQDIVENNVGL